MEQRSPTLMGSRATDHSAPSEKKDVSPFFIVFSVMRRYRTNVSQSVTESLTLRTKLTDVTLVSEDTD